MQDEPSEQAMRAAKQINLDSSDIVFIAHIIDRETKLPALVKVAEAARKYIANPSGLKWVEMERSLTALAAYKAKESK